MLSFNDALDIAKSKSDIFTKYEEYDNAYVFGFEGNNIGGTSPLVVMKDSGDCLALPFWIAEYPDTKLITEGTI